MKRLERHGDDGRFIAGRYGFLVRSTVLSISEVRLFKAEPAAVSPTAAQLALPELG